jgi:hypothetical protein
MAEEKVKFKIPLEGSLVTLTLPLVAYAAVAPHTSESKTSANMQESLRRNEGKVIIRKPPSILR